ncbi:transposase A transposon Tn554, partial [Staphylococcus aureus M1478]|uniref:site-specific integrase n=3 Tax=Staphylococcus aureus TaxID=1280 RepID=UPI0004523A7E
MKVQRIEVENKPYPLYLLLDKEYQLIEPVMKFIKYLDNTGKSPNTIKAYCYHLKLLYEFMEQRGVILNDINFELLADLPVLSKYLINFITGSISWYSL